MPVRILFGFVIFFIFLVSIAGAEPAGSTSLHTTDECTNWKSKHPEWLWCDDFESGDDMNARYYDVVGKLPRTTAEKASGAYSIEARWQKGATSVGHFIRTFGRSPTNSLSHSDRDFREVYWRHYFKLEDSFEGLPDKVSRAFVFAGKNWSQAALGHIWTHQKTGTLSLDPVSAVKNGFLVSRKWNDFQNFQWLGMRRGRTRILPATWYCVEARMKLNDPGESNGVLEFWVDGELEASNRNLDFVGSWGDYGINAVFFSNHWNDGSPKEQSRFFDALVISTERIGCLE